MKKFIHRIIVLSTLGLHPFCGNALAEKNQLLIVTNLEEMTTLSKNQIKQIYLQGGSRAPVKPIGLRSGDRSRNIFNTKIIGLTESRIESYWAQMKFTGRASPPKEFSSIEEVLEFLNTNKGYIAYLPATTDIPESLNVVYSINY